MSSPRPTAAATIAWPDSWYAARLRSAGDSMRPRRCGPCRTRWTASVEQVVLDLRRWPRTVSSAASLMTLARSAPVKPGRRLGEPVEVDVGGDRLACARAARGSPRGPRGRAGRRSRAGRSGRGAGAPGRGCRGGWSRAMTTMPDGTSKPSISTSSWLSVCSRSSEPPPPPPAPRLRAGGVELVDEDDRRGDVAHPGEQVADAGRADADQRLDELGARDREERHAGLAGDRLGEQRLAAAGRAEQQDALGRLRADLLVRSGSAQVVATSCSSSTASSAPATSSNVTAWRRACALAALAERAERLDVAMPRARARPHSEEQQREQVGEDHQRQQERRRDAPDRCLHVLALDPDVRAAVAEVGRSAPAGDRAVGRIVRRIRARGRRHPAPPGPASACATMTASWSRNSARSILPWSESSVRLESRDPFPGRSAPR